MTMMPTTQLVFIATGSEEVFGLHPIQGTARHLAVSSLASAGGQLLELAEIDFLGTLWTGSD